MRRLVIASSALTWATLTAIVLVLAHRRPEESLANGSGLVLALQAAVGCALFAAGAGVLNRRATPLAGSLLIASGLAFNAQALPVPDAGGPVLFTLALVLVAAAAPLAGAAALELGPRAGRAARAVAVAGIGVCALWVGLVPAALFDPAATGCFRCPRNLVLVHGAASLRADVLDSGLRAGVVASLVLCITLLVYAARGAVRHWSVAATNAGGAIALAGAAAALWHEAAARIATTDHAVRVAWVVECSGLALLAATPVVEFARARVQSTRIVDAVLRTVPTADELRIALATSAGDRSLELVFPRPGRPPVDGDGIVVASTFNGQVTTEVVQAGEVVAHLRHEELSAQAARRLADAVRAAGLALEHTSARARLRAQFADLTASRARIVEVADAERRRLERNLHDGAQQRLIALSLTLDSSSGEPALLEARGEILAALDELRSLAHGIHPASLTDGGIVPSVRELADSSTVPLRLDVLPLDRLPEQFESAAYRVVADCVEAAERHGNGKTVSIALEVNDRGLVARMRLPGVRVQTARHRLSHAGDRVIAAGGNLSISQGPGEAIVEVRL